MDGMGQSIERMDWTLQRQHHDMTAFFRGINYVPPPFDSTFLGQNYEGEDEEDDSYAPSSSSPTRPTLKMRSTAIPWTSRTTRTPMLRLFFSLLTMIVAGVNAVGDETVPGTDPVCSKAVEVKQYNAARRLARSIKPAGPLRSPYLTRPIDPSDGLFVLEKRVTNWVLQNPNAPKSPRLLPSSSFFLKLKEPKAMTVRLLGDFIEQQRFVFKGKCFREMVAKRITFPWRDPKATFDYGVATMRHMETYMGDGSKGWNSGLSRLNLKPMLLLRCKYCACILLSPVNALLDKVYEESKKLERERKEKDPK
ncbi:hypothetical protein DM860_011174 [Cuscuta australis]|uniref:Uncharacterized protein n=1 Tax=Cuscuta australis TaxID=267555 RepID=A0A328DAP9_9ASTE|nr:hypothetical protein DM860_011174 [Cuscuta australis]